MNSNTKVVIVESGSGRVGSSALMGLLAISGINMGGRLSNLKGAAPFNKKGYFELVSVNKFMESNCKEYYPTIQNPPIRYLEAVGETHSRAFLELLDAEFGTDARVIALKSYKGLIFPLLRTIHRKYTQLDVRVLRLVRNIRDQAASIRRLWMAAKPAILKRGWKIDLGFIQNTCKAWNAYVPVLYKHYNEFNYSTIQFEKLMSKPVATTQQVFRAIQENPPKNEEILDWIDKRLVHSKAIK